MIQASNGRKYGLVALCLFGLLVFANLQDAQGAQIFSKSPPTPTPLPDSGFNDAILPPEYEHDVSPPPRQTDAGKIRSIDNIRETYSDTLTSLEKNPTASDFSQGYLPRNGDQLYTMPADRGLLTCEDAGNASWTTSNETEFEIVRTCIINAPVPGTIFLNGDASLAYENGTYEAVFALGHNGLVLDGTRRFVNMYDDFGDGWDTGIASNISISVPAGEHRLDLIGARYGGNGTVVALDPSLTALFMPVAGPVLSCSEADASTWTTTSAEFSVIRECSLTVPQDGAVFISASGSIYPAGGPAYVAEFRVGINAATGDLNTQRYVRTYVDSGDGSDRSVGISILKFLEAGRHTFYLVGARAQGTGTVTMLNPSISALYIPNSSGVADTCGASNDLDWENSTSTFTVIHTCELYVDSDSLVLVTANAWVGQSNEYELQVRLGINDSAIGDSGTDRWVNIYDSSGVVSNETVSISRIVPLGRGTHTLYFLGRNYSNNGAGAKALDVTLSALAAYVGSTPDTYEPDNSPARASTISTTGPSQRHTFHTPGDLDWVRFDAVSGNTYRIRTLNLGAASDTVVTLYDSDGITVIQTDDNGGDGLASQISWTTARSGQYYVQIEHFSPTASGLETNYDLSISTNSTSRISYMPIVLRQSVALPVIANGNFERGDDGAWRVNSSTNQLLITDETPNGVSPRSGRYLAWLGGGAEGNSRDERSEISQTVFVPANAGNISLSFYHWIASQDQQQNDDIAYVTVNGTRIRTFNLVQNANTAGWESSTISLNAFRGRTVTIAFVADVNNDLQGSNWFLDDVLLCNSTSRYPCH